MDKNKHFSNVFIVNELVQLWNILGDYVEHMCKDRDDSHGYSHMKIVAENSYKIWTMMNFKHYEFGGDTCNLTKFGSILITSAWLHDIADKKYDESGKLKECLSEFIHGLFNSEEKELILNIIERISFSFEIKMVKEFGKVDWIDKLGYNGSLIRNIVSDADKIEAIGYIGVKRALMYTYEHFKNTNKEINYLTISNNFKLHSEDKLLKLYNEYLNTEQGKIIAKPLHDEFLLYYENDEKLKKVYDELFPNSF